MNLLKVIAKAAEFAGRAGNHALSGDLQEVHGQVAEMVAALEQAEAALEQFDAVRSSGALIHVRRALAGAK